MATEQISLYVSHWTFWCGNLPSKICSKSWSNFWKQISTFGLIYLRFAVLCFYHIRDLRRIHRYLDLNSAKLLANALVSSRLDYCNSLLSGIADTDLAKLQRVQNRLARVVTKSPPFTRSVPLLRSLQWLPEKVRVDFKICLLTYKTLSEKHPVYLHSLLAAPLPSRSLRSNKGITLPVPRVKSNAGKRSFNSCAPFSLEQLTTRSPFIHFSCHLQKMFQDISFWPGLSPIDIGMPDDLLTLWNCFIDSAVEHWFGCRTTEPG